MHLIFVGSQMMVKETVICCTVFGNNNKLNCTSKHFEDLKNNRIFLG